MYNSFTAQKHTQSNFQETKRNHQMSNWTKRYRSEIRPTLISNFHRRINGFAKKMEDEPIVVNHEEDANERAFGRTFNKNMNVSKHSFIFKNCEDWKSIFTPGERAERQEAMKKMSNSNDSLILRNILSQTKYTNKSPEFRTRNKSKDVNPPMKYASNNINVLLKSLPKIKNKYHKSKTRISEKISKKRLFEYEEDNTNDQMSQNLSYTDFDISHSNVRKNPEINVKTEKELIEEEEMKALAKRLYFKSLIDMEQNVKTAKERNQLKDVLIKCGIFKPIRGKVYEDEEVDRFLEMMKSKQN